MKKQMMLFLIVLMGISLILPVSSFARRGGTSVAVGISSGWGPGPGYYRGGWRGPYRHHGWSRPGLFMGASFVNPMYFPPPVYVTRPTIVYVNPVPPDAYAYPDPGLAGQYTGDNPPGEWVTVPGQWVNGQWVPSHKTWIPVNP
jgi:hypothetical protein